MSEFNPSDDQHTFNDALRKGKFEPPTFPHPLREYKVDRAMGESFLRTLAANVDNAKLSGEGFRQFVRNSIPLCFNHDPFTGDTNDY